ncbi:HoxN/HupN/NixA family nickel/cobalt transporter [Microbacterium sp.]|uniref:HoxN/HupN/NixA family nickel/cobalt transporter n=1 Tax=Microbacterium sp. TaxID=51671 RepID=UPI0028A665F2|nr:HoxN/HupN/NixA family nickel/cobalt transporter [Microbacterium sp.]
MARTERAGIARPLIGMGLVIVALLALGWGTFFFVVLPGGYLVNGERVFGTGLAVTAFILGVRHAFDPDHIAAIDNTTRKLVGEGVRPLTVGFWFALGHSTVVIVTVVLLAVGLNVLAVEIASDDSVLHSVAGVWGVLVSGLFLLLIGIINLASLHGIWRVFHGMRAGDFDEEQLEQALQARGFIARILGPVSRQVDRPWKMYVVGVLFGLGFDTATTIALFIVGGTAALAAPWYIVLVLPILFTAGMTLVDTLDGVVMHQAYAWAFASPVRKVYYNLTITIISIAVAFLVSAVGLGGLLAQLTDSRSGVLGWLARLDVENLGYLIVLVLLLAWAASFAYWKLAKVEKRFSIASDGAPDTA